jgi:hypothetical protein
MKPPFGIKIQAIICVVVIFLLLGIWVVKTDAAPMLACIRYFELMGTADDPITEEFYQGTGPIDITMPCIKDKHEYDAVTDNIYGVIAHNSGPANQGNWALTIIPDAAPACPIRQGTGKVTNNGSIINPGFDFFTLRFCWATAQYQNAKLHLTWPNPNNISWKLTMYRKGRS